MIVAAVNLVAYLYLPAEGTADARRVLQRDPVWAAPLLWRSEFRNVLATAMRSRRMDVALAIEAMDAASDLVSGREYAVDSTDVLRLADRSRCSAYDCEYVSLAQALDVPLVTADRQVLRAFPETAVSLADFGQ